MAFALGQLVIAGVRRSGAERCRLKVSTVDFGEPAAFALVTIPAKIVEIFFLDQGQHEGVEGAQFKNDGLIRDGAAGDDFKLFFIDDPGYFRRNTA